MWPQERQRQAPREPEGTSPCGDRGQAPSQQWKRGGGREALVDVSQKQPTTVLVPFALVRLSSGMSRVASLGVILLQDLEEGSTGPQDPQANHLSLGLSGPRKDQGFGCASGCASVCLCPCASVCICVCVCVSADLSQPQRGRLDPSAQGGVVNSGCLPAEPLVSCRRRGRGLPQLLPGSQGPEPAGAEDPGPTDTGLGAQPQSHCPVGSAQGHRAPL